MTFTRFDHLCMAEALQLAARGMESCQPNPRVGCVVAAKGEIVGRGWHHQAGQAHAEIQALASAGDRARGGTAYVTLEPCGHHGRTGPCTDALVQAGVSEVVAASADPNPRVDGSGFEQLRTQGVRVRDGLMEEAARELNEGFFSRVSRGRPWVRVKLAHSLDGRTALRNGESQWISSPESREDVQHWRARSCAILTGVDTVLADDPALTVRLGEAARQPLRVIADSHWRTPPSAKTLALPGEVLIVGSEDAEVPEALRATPARFLGLPRVAGGVNLLQLLRELASREVNEVQVEAGPTLCGALMRAGLVDEVLLYQAPSFLGVEARGMFGMGELTDMTDRVRLEWLDACRIGADLRIRLKPQYGAS